MRLVVDANILVAELLRVNGKELIANEHLELFLAAKAWQEAWHELGKRTSIIAERAQLSEATTAELLEGALALARQRLTVVEAVNYSAAEREARARIPNDPDDWHTVALALVMGADIWTQDKDFLGCGVATWTSATLRAKLGKAAES